MINLIGDLDPETNRSEDCNDTVLLIEQIARQALSLGTNLFSCQEALNQIVSLCQKTQTDPFE